MSPKITLGYNGETISIFLSAKLGRPSGKKTILTPNNQPINGDRSPEADAALLNALVKAHTWQRQLDDREVASVKDIAQAEGLPPSSYVSRILRLTTLAPDIQQAIMNASHPITFTLADVTGPIPICWEEQRIKFGFAAS